MKTLLFGLVFLPVLAFGETSSIVPKVESLEVQYFDQETGEEKTRKYKVGVGLMGSLMFHEVKGQESHSVVGYSADVEFEDGKIGLEEISIDAHKITVETGDKDHKVTGGYSVAGYRYKRVHEIIREKYENRGHVVHSFSLVKIFVKGKKSLSSDGDLSLVYGAEFDAALPEAIASSMIGVEYKNFSFVNEFEYLDSGRWDNKFIQKTNSVRLDYKYNKKFQIGLYHDEVDLDVIATENVFDVEKFNQRESGVRIRYEF